MSEDTAQLISYFSLGLLAYGIVCIAVGYSTPMSAVRTRWVCWSGIASFAVISLNATILFAWHHYLR